MNWLYSESRQAAIRDLRGVLDLVIFWRFSTEIFPE